METKICGWIESIRNLKNIVFIIIFNRERKLQLTVFKKNANKNLIDTVEKLGEQDCIEAIGKIIKSDIAKSGIEMHVRDIKIFSKAQKPLPIDIKTETSERDKRIKYRYLDLRNERIRRIFELKSKVCTFLHEFFNRNGFIEVHTPIIQAAGAEGGATLFNLKYYGKNAFLRQSPQLYKQILMASSFNKVYEIGPAFRAEKFHTRRHVSEFISVDTEISFINNEKDVIGVLEKMVKFIIKKLKRENSIHIDAGKKFKRIRYDNALEILREFGIKIEWGSDLKDSHETLIGKYMKERKINFYFITKYPSSLKPFYIMKDGDISRGFDFDMLGMELASGGQREHRYDKLIQEMKNIGLETKRFEFYLNAFKYGMPPHGGFGFGLERFIEMLLKLNDIKEAILFPRTPENLIP